MSRFPVLLFLLLLYTAAPAQTPRIAHKSHSGAAADYHRALAEGLFDIGYSNFGVAPTREVKNAQLDSVIFLSDSAAVMVTSEFCTRVDRASGKPLDNPRLWKAGRDTVIRHPLFSRQHALDSIRRVLKNEYNFQNPVENVIFQGYDNGRKSSKRKNKRQDFIPAAPTGNDDAGPFDRNFFGILLAIVLLSALTAAFIQFRFRPASGRRSMA